MQPINSLIDAKAFIESVDAAAEFFEMSIADSLLDQTGANMAILLDQILAKVIFPDGCKQFPGYNFTDMCRCN